MPTGEGMLQRNKSADKAALDDKTEASESGKEYNEAKGTASAAKGEQRSTGEYYR